MNFVYGFILASITAALGHVAWILTMTSNPLGLGGLLPWVFITSAPILFYVLGVTSVPEVEDDWERIVLETGIDLEDLLLDLD